MNTDKERLLRKNLIEEYRRITKEVERLKKENKYLKELIDYQKTKKVSR